MYKPLIIYIHLLLMASEPVRGLVQSHTTYGQRYSKRVNVHALHVEKPPGMPSGTIRVTLSTELGISPDTIWCGPTPPLP